MNDYFLPDLSISLPKHVKTRYARWPDSDPPESWVIGGKFTRNRGGKPVTDRRTPTQKDRDRILYSSLFQRLQGVTQIVSPQQDRASLHNRLSHSLKVASVAKAIAENLLREAYDDASGNMAKLIAEAGGLDANACEAAGLAHDIGHPPYGHVAEVVMDQWLRYDSDVARRCENGFEGNAQSFRSVAYLERRTETSAGLELTAVTMAAILKYPWTRAIGDVKRQDKFGAFHAENETLVHARSWFDEVVGSGDLEQTLEAAIMDIADDITYAIHDLQDFISAGVLRPEEMINLLLMVKQNVGQVTQGHTGATSAPEPADGGGGETPAEPITPGLEQVPERPSFIVRNPQQIDAFMAKVKKLEANYAPFFNHGEYVQAIDFCVDKIEAWSLQSQAPMSSERLKAFGSILIEIAVEGIRFLDPKEDRPWPHGPRIHLDKPSWHWIQVLKDLTKVMVIETPMVGIQQMAETESLRELLSKLDDWSRSSGMRAGLPDRLKALLVWSEDESRRQQALAGFAEDPIRRAVVDYCCSLTDAEAHLVSRYVRGMEVPTALI